MIGIKTRIKAADYAALPVRSGITVKAGDQEIAVFKITNGEVYAVENRSPHPKGGTLADGLVSGEFLYCPLFDWKISLVDGRVQAPDEGQVKTYPVEITDGEVYLVI